MMVFVFPYCSFKSNPEALRRDTENKVKHRAIEYQRCKTNLLSKIQDRIINYLTGELQPCNVRVYKPQDTSDFLGGYEYNFRFMYEWLHKQIRINKKGFFFKEEAIDELFFEGENNINFNDYRVMLGRDMSRVDADIPHMNNLVLETIKEKFQNQLHPLLIFDINIDFDTHCFLKVYYGR